MKPAALLLAAGASRRLGRPKQLVRKEGESLLRRTARLAASAGCAPIVVVLGFQAEVFSEELVGLGRGLTVESVINSGWGHGMASSLRCGLMTLLPRGPESVLVLVCDQPRLTAAVLTALIDKHQETGPDITASSYSGIKGVPAIFDRSVFPALMELSGDQGARRIIVDPRWKVSTVEFPGGAIDIDRPSDLQSL